MKATKIEQNDVEEMKISSLPSRPTAPTAMGGKGFTAAEMKAAFDKLPLHLVSKYNDLIDDIFSSEDGLTSALLTGISDGHTLKDLLSDITDGTFASYLRVGEDVLYAVITDMKAADIDRDYKITLLERLANDSVIECGKCSYRNSSGGFA